MSAPLVSVIMPVYNAERFVGASLKSILGQQYSKLQVVVVNDGSTDGSEDVIRSFDDPRIVYLSQANGGVSAALNTALKAATGSLIARQDADDISAPERIAKQVQFFQNNPDTVILGSWGSYMAGTAAQDSELVRPTTDAAIRFALLFDSPFVSTSVMASASAFAIAGGFDGSERVWDDYDMWSRLVAVGKAANLPERLVQYRVVGSGLTQTNTRSADWVKEQRRRNIAAAIRDFPPDLLLPYLGMGIDHPAVSATTLRRLRSEFQRYIASITQDAAEREQLQARLQALLMSCRIVPHNSMLHRVIDHLAKRKALLGPARNGNVQ